MAGGTRDAVPTRSAGTCKGGMSQTSLPRTNNRLRLSSDPGAKICLAASREAIKKSAMLVNTAGLSTAAIVKLRRFRETKGATGGPAPRNRRAHEDGRRSHNDNRSESRYGRVEPALQRTMRNSLLAMAQGRHTR